MSSSLALLSNYRSFAIDLSYSYLYLHDLYPAISDIYFMICVHCCPMHEMISQLALELQHLLQYSIVCSSMMSVHPEGGGSARDARVSLTSVDMVSRIAKCCQMSTIPTILQRQPAGGDSPVRALVILHIRYGGQEVHKAVGVYGLLPLLRQRSPCCVV